MPGRQHTTPQSGEGMRDGPSAVATKSMVPLPEPLGGPTMPDPQVRHEMIACAAYCRAEKRNFAGGAESQFQDWIEAEAEIDRMLAEAAAKP